MNQLKRVMSSSKRRSYLGLGVCNYNGARLGTIDTVCHSDVPYKNPWAMLQRSKFLLSLRTIEDPALIAKLDKRKDWNKERHEVVNLLDVFSSLQHSYSSTLPKKSNPDGIVNVCRSLDTNRTFLSDIARSHSIRLDPVDSPKELKKYRLRIQRVIDWSYKNDLVPVMMTLTIYHRWDNLEPLCNALRLAWSNLFGSGKAGFKRKCHIDLRGYTRRMEETLNDGSEFELGDNSGTLSLGNAESEKGTWSRSTPVACRDLSNDMPDTPPTLAAATLSLNNAGWHPHYHIILLIPRDKLQVLSDYEETLKEVWLKLVCKYYKKEVGKEVPVAYYDALRKHGLVLSRYKSEEHAKRCGNRHGKAGELLQVHDGTYLAKTMGYDSPEIFGGDSEMTSFNSKSNLKGDGDLTHIGGKVPFDLLCEDDVTASTTDLWCEYAIATKNIPCFRFSQGLEKTVNEYYKAHPEAEYVKMSFSTNPSNFVVVGSFARNDYKKIYQSKQTGNMLEVAKDGPDKLAEWSKDNFDVYLFKPNTNKTSLPSQSDDEFLISSSPPLVTCVANKLKEQIQVNEEDLAVAEKMENDVYTTYHVHLKPLVSNGLSIDAAINSLNISDSQKDLLRNLAFCYRANIRKSKERLENLNIGNSIPSEPPPDIQDSSQYERWLDREFEKQSAYHTLANSKNIPPSMKEKLFNLIEDYYSS